MNEKLISFFFFSIVLVNLWMLQKGNIKETLSCCIKVWRMGWGKCREVNEGWMTQNRTTIATVNLSWLSVMMKKVCLAISTCDASLRVSVYIYVAFWGHKWWKKTWHEYFPFSQNNENPCIWHFAHDFWFTIHKNYFIRVSDVYTSFAILKQCFQQSCAMTTTRVELEIDTIWISFALFFNNTPRISLGAMNRVI